MNQQVNLYQSMFRKQKQMLSASQVIQIFVAGVVVLLSDYAWIEWQSLDLSQNIANLQSQRDVELGRMGELQKKLTSNAPNKLLAAQVGKVTRELESKRDLSKVLSAGTFGNTDGFSSYLETLAQRRIDGMWLTGLSIRDGGSELGIRGSTLRPELVPVFIQRLAGSGDFTGVVFQHLQMIRAEDDETRIDFDLQTSQLQVEAQ